MAEIIHTADTHIGYRQYHKEERKQDFNDAFASVIDDAIEMDIDAIVHAGDLFHRSRPSITDLSFVVSQLQRLKETNIDFLMVVGNHDRTREQKWPSFFEHLGLGIYLSEAGNADSGGYTIGDVTFHAQDYVGEGKRDRLNYHFEEGDGEYAVLVSHGLFTPFDHATWDMNEIISKSPISFDALLVGDDHTPKNSEISGIPIAYSGSTERTAADQRHPRGYNLVTTNEDGVDIRWKEIDTREFVYIDIELDEDQGKEYVQQKVEQWQIPVGSVVIVTLSGDGERVPPADIEQITDRKDALLIRVNDQREFEEEEHDFEGVGFTDPDLALRRESEDLRISEIAAEIESMARDVDTFAKSNLRDRTEELVERKVDDSDELEEFQRGEIDLQIEQSELQQDNGNRESERSSSIDQSDDKNAEEISEGNSTEKSQESSGVSTSEQNNLEKQDGGSDAVSGSGNTAEEMTPERSSPQTSQSQSNEEHSSDDEATQATFDQL